jgi:hypothetical protein
MTQVVWQVAACELHAIMQFVTIELCAMRIRPAAAECHRQPASNEQTCKSPQRMMHFLSASITAPAERNALGAMPAA